MRIGVVSDTHGHVANTRAAIHMLDALEVDVVLHCGDIGSAAIVFLFDSWPTHFVLGNVDQYEPRVEQAIEKAGLHNHGRFGELCLDDVKIAWLHGDDSRRLLETIESQRWQLVCHGHTHRPEIRQVGRTIVLNPGALYRAARHTIAVVDVPSLETTLIEID